MSSRSENESYIDDLVDFEKRCDSKHGDTQRVQSNEHDAASECTSYVDDLDAFSQRANPTFLAGLADRSGKTRSEKVHAKGQEQPTYTKFKTVKDEVAHIRQGEAVAKSLSTEAAKKHDQAVFVQKMPPRVKVKQGPIKVKTNNLVEAVPKDKEAGKVVFMRKTVKRDKSTSQLPTLWPLVLNSPALKVRKAPKLVKNQDKKVKVKSTPGPSPSSTKPAFLAEDKNIVPATEDVALGGSAPSVKNNPDKQQTVASAELIVHKSHSKQTPILSQHASSINNQSVSSPVLVIGSNEDPSILDAASHLPAVEGRWMSGALPPESFASQPDLDAASASSWSSSSTEQAMQALYSAVLDEPHEIPMQSPDPAAWLSNLEPANSMPNTRVQTLSSSSSGASSTHAREGSEVDGTSQHATAEPVEVLTGCDHNKPLDQPMRPDASQVASPSLYQAPSSAYHPPTVESVKSSHSSHIHTKPSTRADDRSEASTRGGSWIDNDNLDDAINNWRETAAEERARYGAAEDSIPWVPIRPTNLRSSDGGQHSSERSNVSAAHVPLPSSKTSGS